jgi:hypothetical protein
VKLTVKTRPDQGLLLPQGSSYRQSPAPWTACEQRLQVPVREKQRKLESARAAKAMVKPS